MDSVFEPIHFDPANDGVKFSMMGDGGLSQAIEKQMKARQGVWKSDLWPDEKTEKVAKKCAEIFGEELGLPATFVPGDSIWLLVKYDDDGVEFACEALQDEFGCKINFQELNKRKLLTFGDMVEIAKTGTGKVIHPPPTKFQACKAWAGCAWGLFMLLGIPLIGVALLVWHIVRYFTEG